MPPTFRLRIDKFSRGAQLTFALDLELTLTFGPNLVYHGYIPSSVLKLSDQSSASQS